jgi:transcriptional regulator with PAS, ATPase and Fis domain
LHQLHTSSHRVAVAVNLLKTAATPRMRPTTLDAPDLVFANTKMAGVVAMAARAAVCDGKVLITGESGVGKDLIARYIHAQSPRHGLPFIAVNCAGLAETLLESELFGHVRGSFTGAYRDKPGKLQAANRGTLFLDEVGEMSLRMQALLLRFLENGEIQAVGSDASVTRVDVRILAATNRNLAELVASGQFREDLLYRLRVIHLHVPPLRERPEDLSLLVSQFVGSTRRSIRFSEPALRLLQQYRWPGNVRELQNVIEQIVWMTEGEVIDVEQLPTAICAQTQTILSMRERRCQVADQLYEAVVTGGYSFWEHIYPLFLARDITRHDVRQLVRRGLATTHGNYRALLKLFGLPFRDYKRFLNFLAAHDCRTDFREFRNGAPEPAVRALPVVLPRLRAVGAEIASANDSRQPIES